MACIAVKRCPIWTSSRKSWKKSLQTRRPAITSCPSGWWTHRLILVTDTDQTFKQRAVLEQELNQKIKLLLCEEENLRMALLKFYDVTNYRQEGSSQKRDVDVDMTPLKGAINEMLQDAARQKASDIHMLPALNGFKVSFRIAGHMVDVTHDHFFPASQVENVTNLIKLMDDSRNVDVMRTNMPNEGSFYLHRGSQDIFIRLETLPVGSDGQEKINLRLLPQAGRTQSTKKTLTPSATSRKTWMP